MKKLNTFKDFEGKTRKRQGKNLYFSSEIKQSCSLTWDGCSAQVPARQLCSELVKTQDLCCPTLTPMCESSGMRAELSTAPPND